MENEQTREVTIDDIDIDFSGRPWVFQFTGTMHCVDEETEYFNGHGWKKISEYKEDDSVLQYNEDGTANLVKPLDYIVNNCDKFYDISCSKFNMVVTPEHDLVYKTSKGNLYKKKAKDFFEQHNNSKTGHSGKFICEFNYKNDSHNELYNNEWLIRLMIAISADGTKNYKHNSDLVYFNLKKERKIKRLKLILNKNNIDFKETIYDDGFHRITFYFKYFNKKLDWIYLVNTDYYNVIAEEILMWDGYITKHGGGVYSSTIKENADVVQFVWSSLGYYSSIYVDKRPNRNDCYCVIKGNKKSNGHSFCDNKNGRKAVIKEIDCNSKCYCFTVPSGMLVLRRNNKIFVTGNSGKDTCAALLKGILEERGMRVLCLNYADFLKAICARNFGYNDNNKEKGREILQNFGTKVREKEKDFWIHTVFHFFDLMRFDYDAFIIADCRYENELQPSPYIFTYPIVNIYVARKVEENLKNIDHESESMARNFDEDVYHWIVNNNGSIDNTREQLVEMIEYFEPLRERKMASQILGIATYFNKDKEEENNE